jgi:flagella basal body P-ring formation protein FlgA
MEWQMRRAAIFLLAVVLMMTVLLGLSLAYGALVEEKTPALQSEAVVKALRVHVADVLQADVATVSVRILSLPEGISITPTTVVTHTGSGNPIGRVTFLVGTARVMAEVEALKEVVVAKRFLRRNQVLEEGDLMVGQVRLAWSDARFLEAPELAVGKRLIRAVQSRYAVTEDVLGEPFTIRQGARLTIQYLSGPLKVMAQGVAKDDGPIGGTIRVTNLDSKKELWARIVSADTVQVGP